MDVSTRSAGRMLPAGWSGQLLSVVGGLLLAVVAGLVAATGDPLPVALFVSAMFGVFLAFVPKTMIWIVLVGGTIFAGTTTLYFPRLGPLRWGVVLAAVLLAVSALVVWVLKVLRRRAASVRSPARFSALTFCASTFVFVALLSTVLNWGFSANAIVGLKNYFQVWGLLLAFALVPLSPRDANRYFLFLLPLGLLQLPLVAHQFLVLAPQRAGLTEVDVVVGTFVGSLRGGGANALLAMVQVICIAILAAFWRRARISGPAGSLLSVLFLLPVLLNEAKIVVLALPVALGVVFWDYLKRHLFVALVILGITGALMTALMWLYAEKLQSTRHQSVAQYWQQTLDYNIGERGYARYILNRTSVYPFWLKEHSLSDGLRVLIGHGPSSTKEGDGGLIGNTVAKSRYPGLGIGLTAMSALLWEVGIAGLIAALGLFWSAFFVSGRLSRECADPLSASLLKAAQAGIAVFAISLLHNQSFVFEIGYQTILMLLLGYIMAQERFSHERRQTNA